MQEKVRQRAASPRVGEASHRTAPRSTAPHRSALPTHAARRGLGTAPVARGDPGAGEAGGEGRLVLSRGHTEAMPPAQPCPSPEPLLGRGGPEAAAPSLSLAHSRLVVLQGETRVQLPFNPGALRTRYEAGFAAGSCLSAGLNLDVGKRQVLTEQGAQFLAALFC